MQTFDGVVTNKLNGLLNESAPGEDNVALLIYAVPTADLPAGWAHNVKKELLQPQDAIDLGWTESHDANESLWVLGAIKEVFSYAPQSVLHLVTVNTGSLPSAILATDAIKGQIRAASKVKVIAIAGTGHTPVELAADAEDVQTEINTFATEHRLIDAVLLQGNDKAAPDDWDIADLVDLTTLNAPNVSITIAQDPYVAALDAAYAKQADIGSALGMLMVRRVNENLGSVDIVSKPREYKADENYTLSRGQRWKNAQFSNGDKVENISMTTQTAITNKGYIFVGSYAGYNGLYFNDSRTAVAATSDYNRIENNRTWNKASRLIRKALMPRVKGIVKKVPATGNIRPSVISGWTGLCNKALDEMVKADEISGYEVTISPNQTPSSTSPVQVKALVVKDGISHSFSVDLGLTNSI